MSATILLSIIALLFTPMYGLLVWVIKLATTNTADIKTIMTNHLTHIEKDIAELKSKK